MDSLVVVWGVHVGVEAQGEWRVEGHDKEVLGVAGVDR